MPLRDGGRYEDKHRGWLRAQILRAAADDEAAVGPLGKNDRPRGFFQWLRIKDARAARPPRKRGLPDDVAAAIGDFAAPDTPVDFLPRLQEYDGLKEDDDDDKRAALRHARGPTRDAKWQAMLASWSKSFKSKA